MTIQKQKEDLVFKRIQKYIVTLTQEEAGFHQKVQDVLHHVPAPACLKLADYIKKHKVYTFKDGSVYVADTIAKEFQAICQLSGGTLKMSDTDFKLLSDHKIKFIRDHFHGKKFAIYYKYKAERVALMDAFSDLVTEDSVEFQETGVEKIFIGQYRSKMEGVKLDKADDIIFYSMPFSNLEYLQSRERIMSRSKTSECKCHILITGIDQQIYDTVKNHKGKFNTEAYRRNKNVK